MSDEELLIIAQENLELADRNDNDWDQINAYAQTSIAASQLVIARNSVQTDGMVVPDIIDSSLMSGKPTEEY